MHTYSTDGESRVTISGWLGVFSFVIVVGFDHLSNAIPSYAPYGLNSIVPTVGLVLGVIFLIWSKKIWSIDTLKNWGIIGTPDLSGEWSGTLYSSYNDDLDALEEEGVGTDITVRVQQTWRQILIELEGPDSHSKSTSASFVTTGVDPEVRYQYKNRPDIDSPDSMSSHIGNAVLSYLEQDDQPDELIGWYYTGPQRQSYGTIKVTMDE